MRKIFFIIFLLSLCFSFAKNKTVLYFSPLPTKSHDEVLKDFLPILTYLEKKLQLKIKVKYKDNYKDILDGIKNGSIDLAYLGPLPYISLRKEYSFVEPLVVFREKNQKHNYRCVLVKFKEDKIPNNKKIKVALTQPLSTCGYFMSSILLKKEFDIDLSKQKYDYKMSHENALLSTLSGDALIAGAKDSIAKKLESLGLEIISKSQVLPGFSLVINSKTIPKELQDKLKTTILQTPKSIYSKWKAKGSYGFDEVSHRDYGNLSVDMNKIPKNGNLNE